MVTDERNELRREIRKLAQAKGLEPGVAAFRSDGLIIEPRVVIHTSHPTFGYLIHFHGTKIVWAPEFLVFPSWAKGADLMFAEAAGWKRPILFRGRVGGHACVDQVARDAPKYKVKRLVFAHIGRPTIKAIDAGKRIVFGEFGADGDVFRLNSAGKFAKRRSGLHNKVPAQSSSDTVRESSHVRIPFPLPVRITGHKSVGNLRVHKACALR